jgi:CMP-N-acetylneuraminic acid synthetase
MRVVAVVPAREHSKGIVGKNLRRLGDRNLIEIAVMCALDAGCDEIWVNCTISLYRQLTPTLWKIAQHWPRPLALDADDTPMFAVIDEMRRGGAFENEGAAIALLQCTQPLRTPEHVKAAIALLRDSGADSVVSVVALPLTHRPEFVLRVYEPTGDLEPYCDDFASLGDMPTQRQGGPPRYIRDGTVYAFWRKTVDQHGTIYGQDVRPLIIPPEDTCELDTEQDWAALEARWKARHG